ncbi:MAG: hypothetical protein GF355_09100 [Candidatus Eisenbacteria bacterium]|nr:hypothetical protein [Candidatus Eisenbacteria bacterium]
MKQLSAFSMAMALAAAGLAAALVLPGCEDDLSPSQGTLRVELTSNAEGGTQNVEVYVDGELMTDALEDGVLELHLEPGEYSVRAVPADTCATADPPDASLRVEAGRTASGTIAIRVGSGLEIVSNVAGLPILLDGEPTGRVTPATLGCVTPGMHRVELQLDCSGTPYTVGQDCVAPEDSIFTVEILAPTLEVASNAACVDVYLDGAPTGYLTRQTIPCVAPGSHTVSLVHDEEILASTEIEMDEAPLTVHLDVDVEREIIMEVLGYLTCSNCPLADEVTHDLVRDPEFAGRVHRLEIHHSFGPEIFATTQTAERNDYYDPDGHPYTVINGTDGFLGAPGYDALYSNLAQSSRGHLEDAQTSWLIVLRDLEAVEPYDPQSHGGELYNLTACVSLIDEPSTGTPVLYAYAYKTDIDWQNPYHPEQTEFHDVVRTIVGPIPLNEAPYELAEAGDAAQINLEIRYPTNEVDLYGEPWEFGGYGIVVFIQTAGSFPQGPVQQAAHIAWSAG